MLKINKLSNVTFSSVLLICSGNAADIMMIEGNQQERSHPYQKLTTDELPQESTHLPELKAQELFSLPRDLDKLNNTLKDPTVEKVILHLPKNTSYEDISRVQGFLDIKGLNFSNIRSLTILYSLNAPPLLHPTPGTNEDHGNAVVKALLPFIKESLMLEKLTLTYVLADTVLPELSEHVSICLDCTGHYRITDQIYNLPYLKDLATDTLKKYQSLSPNRSISAQFKNVLSGKEFLYK